MNHDRWIEMLKGQWLAGLDTLENAIKACPVELFNDRTRRYQIWYWVSHTVFWADYYLTADADSFRPPEPFGLEELDPDGVMPDPPHNQKQLLEYVEYVRRKAIQMFDSMTEAEAEKEYHLRKASLKWPELQMYSMRHLQHHSAQINLILREETDSAPGWVFRGRLTA